MIWPRMVLVKSLNRQNHFYSNNQPLIVCIIRGYFSCKNTTQGHENMYNVCNNSKQLSINLIRYPPIWITTITQIWKLSAIFFHFLGGTWATLHLKEPFDFLHISVIWELCNLHVCSERLWGKAKNLISLRELSLK